MLFGALARTLLQGPRRADIPSAQARKSLQTGDDMMMTFKRKLLFSALAVASLPVSVYAAPVDFNAGGIETVTSITTFDWGPSNVIALNGNQAFADFVNSGGTCAGTTTGCNFQVYGQGRLQAFVGDPTTQLNTAYEITFEIAFGEHFTFAAQGGGLNIATFGFGWTGAGTPENYFRMYFDVPGDSNDLAGTGFKNGTQIMSGTVAPEGPFTSGFNANTAQPLPNIGGNISVNGGDGTPAAWAGYTTVTGAGSSSTLDLLSVITDTYDPTFFLTPLETFLMSNISQILAYTTVDPALLFNQGGLNIVTQNVVGGAPCGNINGGTSTAGGVVTACGSSIIFQTDPNSPVSGQVPEPGSLALLGLSLAAMAAVSRRRRQA
jgi:hypothetical protein